MVDTRGLGAIAYLLPRITNRFQEMEPNCESLPGYTLLIPSLGIGNAGQLAVDLLINSLASTNAIRHVATLRSKHIEPAAGVNPFDSQLGNNGITTALELYAVDSVKLAILQQRAPAAEGEHELFALELLRFVKAAGIAKVVCVGGIDAALRGDAELSAAGGDTSALPTAVFVSTRPDQAAATAGVPCWCGGDGTTLPSATQAALDDSDSEDVPSDLPGWDPIAPGAVAATRALLSQALGAGYAPVYYRRFLNDAIKSPADATAFTALMAFVSEGDNTPDAHRVAKLLSRYCGLQTLLPSDAALVQPSYWSRLHGPGFDQMLYG